MTAQEVFDIAAKGLLKQKRRSTDACGFCQYRGLERKKCAVGFLLTDEEAKTMEGYNVRDAVARNLLPHRLCAHVTLLAYLQEVHDNKHPAKWPLELQKLAEKHELKFSAR